jgi:hypothetical protein
MRTSFGKAISFSVIVSPTSRTSFAEYYFVTLCHFVWPGTKVAHDRHRLKLTLRSLVILSPNVSQLTQRAKIQFVLHDYWIELLLFTCCSK